MLTPAKLRGDARLAREAALIELHPLLSRALAERALELAQLADKLERAPGVGYGWPGFS